MEEVAVVILVLMIGAMFIMVPIWFFSVTKYLKYIRENHSEVYKEMGEPSLFVNNTPSNNISFLRYVFGNKYLATNDNQLISKSLFLKRLFYIYLFTFIGVIIMVSSLGNS